MDQAKPRSAGSDYNAGSTNPSSSSMAGSPVRDALKEGKQGVVDAAGTATESAKGDLTALRSDLTSLSQTVASFISEASSEAGKAASNASGAIGKQISTSVGEAGSKVATAVSNQAKTFTSYLEETGRNHPLGAMAGALAVGLLIGLVSRR